MTCSIINYRRNDTNNGRRDALLKSIFTFNIPHAKVLMYVSLKGSIDFGYNGNNTRSYLNLLKIYVFSKDI